MGMKAIIVGASSGIGHEVARLLIKAGWMVGVAARRVERLQDLGAAWVAEIDVTREDAPDSLRSMIEAMGGIDLYLHVAGIGRQNRTLEADIELATVETNGMGFARMVGEAFRYFASVGRGHVACISSIAGTKGLGPAPSYSATKAFQNTYMQALEQLAHTRELAIHFTDIRPGFVDTDLLSGAGHYPMLLRVEPVARSIVKAIEQRRRVVIIDWRWCVLTAFWRCIPNGVWRRMRL